MQRNGVGSREELGSAQVDKEKKLVASCDDRSYPGGAKGGGAIMSRGDVISSGRSGREYDHILTSDQNSEKTALDKAQKIYSSSDYQMARTPVGTNRTRVLRRELQVACKSTSYLIDINLLSRSLHYSRLNINAFLFVRNNSCRKRLNNFHSVAVSPR